MGEYVLKKMLGMHSRCENCRRPNYQHVEVFYWAHLYTKVELESRIVETEFEMAGSPAFDCDAMFEELARLTNNQKIETYIECLDCHAQLCKKFTMRQEHLELSLIAYIGHIFHSTHVTFLKDPPETPKCEVCPHDRKCRVFQLGGYFLRMYVDFLVLSSEFKLSVGESQTLIRKK